MPAIDLRNPRHWVEILPDFVRLVWRVVRDDRVPGPLRAGLVAVAAYMALPIDIVPDWVPFAGQIDDLLVLTVGIRLLLRRIPQEVLLEHWSGDHETLNQIVGRQLVA